MVSQDVRKPVRTLVVYHWAFFCRRDKRNIILPEWSPMMLRDASNKWPWVLVLDHKWIVGNTIHPKTNVNSEIFRFKLHNVESIVFDPSNPTDSIEEVKRGIIRNGGKFDLPENPYDFAIHNIQNFVIGRHFTWAGQNDHERVKIRLDKPLNFKEIAAQRAAKTIW